MTKKTLIFITVATVFTLGVGTITISGLNQVEKMKTQATGERTISFQVNNLNATSLDLVVAGELVDKSSVYMKVSDFASCDEDSFVATYGTQVRFYTSSLCESQYRFQDLKSATIHHAANNQTVKVNVIKDAETQKTFFAEAGSVQTFFDLADTRNFALDFTTENNLDITSIDLEYTCSYSFDDSENVETFTVYASNDFHGYIEEGNSAGLKAWGTYAREKSHEFNTLLLDQGDTWQGTLYSNMNRGNIINDVMCYAGYDARTVGNHDFDWGVDAVKTNTARTYTAPNGRVYSMPTLAANVYDFNFETKEFGTTQQSDIGGKTVTYTLENGIKVGVVGLIGSDQITSINSLYTQNIGFKDHIQTIKDEATNLRNAGCDVVICSIHAGIYKKLSDSDRLDNKGLNDYVDLVLGAHTHQTEKAVEGNTHYYQFSSNGSLFGKITMQVNKATHVVSVVGEAQQLTAATIKTTVGSDYDPIIADIVDTNKTTCDTVGSEELATNIVYKPHPKDMDSYFDSYDGTIYFGNRTEWTTVKKLYPEASPENRNWHYVAGTVDAGNCIDGHYYIESDTGKIYLYDGSSLVEKEQMTGYWYCWNSHSSNLNIDQNVIGPNIMARAIYDQAILEGYNVDLAYCNQSRSTLYGPELTFADIYQAFPFDNTVYIIEVTGKELLDEVMLWNNVCFNPEKVNMSVDADDPTTTYRIACLDYLAFHTNASRNYDYFPSIEEQTPKTLSKNYREIIRGWFKTNNYDKGTELNLRDFDNDVSRFNRFNFDVVTTRQATFKLNNGSADIVRTLSYNSDITKYWNRPDDPTRDGYTFLGWYLDEELTNPLSERDYYYLSKDTTFYARWAVVYSTGQLDFNTFKVGTSSSQATANATVGEGSVNLTFTHSSIVDKSSFSEFGIGNYGYLSLTVPSGYTILSLEVKIYNTYDNFDFYRGTNDSGDLLTKSKTNYSGYCIYRVNVEGDSLYIKNTYNGVVAVYYISVVLAAAA